MAEPRIVLVDQYGPLPPALAELVDDPSVPAHLAKIIYCDSRTGARVRPARIIDDPQAVAAALSAKEKRMPPIATAVPATKKTTARKRAKAAPPASYAGDDRPLENLNVLDTYPAAEAPMAGVVEVAADPQTLVIGKNVRLDPRVDEALVASIREHGVLQPVTAYRDNGDLVVVHGQRRVRAAIAAGAVTVPVRVVPTAGAADTIARQLVENDARAELTMPERVAAWEQLAALGVKPQQIAKSTGARREDVVAGLAVAKSATARARLVGDDDAPPMTLQQAAVIAEFEGDDQAVQELTYRAQYGAFDHHAEYLRQVKAVEAARAKLTRKLIPTGVRVADADVLKDRDTADLMDLGHDGVQLTPETHASCPGHAAYVDYLDPDEWIQAYDWEAPEGEDGKQVLRLPEDGSVVQDEHGIWFVVYVCTAFQEHGHSFDYNLSGPSAEAGDDAAAQAAREREEARRRDVERREAWKASETVRRSWLRQHLTVKKLPAGAAAFAADWMYEHGTSGSIVHDPSLLEQLLLGTQAEKNAHPVRKLIEQASEARSLVLVYAMCLASAERWCYEQSHRAPYYLRYLAGQGYELSDVERQVAGLDGTEGGDE